jgi:hypothetical protein
LFYRPGQNTGTLTSEYEMIFHNNSPPNTPDELASPTAQVNQSHITPLKRTS